MRNPDAQLRLLELRSYQTVWTQSAVSILGSEEKLGHASFIELFSNSIQH